MPYAEIKEDENTPVLQYLLKRPVLASLIKQSEDVAEEIERYVPKIRNLRNTRKWRVILIWISRRKEMEEMLPKMESLKSSFCVVMHAIQLEEIRSKPRTRESNTEMEVQRVNFRRYMLTSDQKKAQEYHRHPSQND